LRKPTHLPDGMAADLAAECANYERLIAESGGIDLQLLGIGQNGHLGFNEPLSALRSRTRVKVLSPGDARPRTRPLFSRARSGAAARDYDGGRFDSRIAVAAFCWPPARKRRRCLQGGLKARITSMISATALQLHPECALILDEAAGSKLKESEYYHWVFENQPEWEPFRAAASLAAKKWISKPGTNRGKKTVERCLMFWNEAMHRVRRLQIIANVPRNIVHTDAVKDELPSSEVDGRDKSFS